MNKGEFGKAVTKIVKKYPCRMEILGEDKDLILESCKKVSRYQKLASEEGVIVKTGWHQLPNKRKVKMIFLSRKGTRFRIPVSKSVLVETLYPTKRRGNSQSPEKVHRGKVLQAMRNMVAYQLSDYRNSLSYPLTCWRSQRRIIKGMKCDVDHIGDPFVKIAEDFLDEKSLKFAEVILAGTVNDKRFKDPELQEEWEDFHEERACLALVLSSVNRSAGSGDYSSREELLGSFSMSLPI